MPPIAHKQLCEATLALLAFYFYGLPVLYEMTKKIAPWISLLPFLFLAKSCAPHLGRIWGGSSTTIDVFWFAACGIVLVIGIMFSELVAASIAVRLIIRFFPLDKFGSASASSAQTAPVRTHTRKSTTVLKQNPRASPAAQAPSPVPQKKRRGPLSFSPASPSAGPARAPAPAKGPSSPPPQRLIGIAKCNTTGCSRKAWDGQPSQQCCRTCHSSRCKPFSCLHVEIGTQSSIIFPIFHVDIFQFISHSFPLTFFSLFLPFSVHPHSFPF